MGRDLGRVGAARRGRHVQSRAGGRASSNCRCSASKASSGRAPPASKNLAKAANYLGLSDKAAAGAAASIGEAAVALGLSQEEAAGLTPQLIKVVANLATLTGMPVGAALETVNAAMRGEYDSLQRLVPTISNATIVQRAMKDSHVGPGLALTAEQKTRAGTQPDRRRRYGDR